MFLGVQFKKKWKNLCVLVAPRVNPAATHLCLLHGTASNVSFHIYSSAPLTYCSAILVWLWAYVHFTSYVEADFGLCYSLTVLLCRYPAEPLAATLLQLHGTVC